MALERQFTRAEARADAYLKQLVLRWLKFTQSELHYLNRLVEDLGVDASILASTLADLERQELVTGHVEQGRGAHYTLTQRGQAWPRPTSAVE
jgi:DNA-binding HxlR family transcriptional regulator